MEKLKQPTKTTQEQQTNKQTKTDERHISLILISAYIHKDVSTAGRGCDVPEDNKLVETIMICSAFNAQPSL